MNKMLGDGKKDYLTGLFLRESLQPLLERLIMESNNGKINFSLALIDVDRFKKFNDKFGHNFGDEILKYVSSILRMTFYQGSTYIFRYGGDEFIVVFPERHSREAFFLLRLCINNFNRHLFLYHNKVYRIKISCGISAFPRDSKTIDGIIKKADEAMYFSKRCGHNRIAIASKIRYLKLLRLFSLCLSFLAILLSFFLFYQLTYKKYIGPTLRKVKNIRFAAEPEGAVVIILKNGSTFKGQIINETRDMLLVDLYLDEGKGSVSFQKSEISKIVYQKKELQGPSGP